MLKYLIAIISCSYVAAVTDADGPIISLSSGKILGKVIPVTTGGTNWTIFSYVGIPFAAPPIGELRFQPPKPPSSWQGVLDCRTYDRKCFQVKVDDKRETEDCLHINVFTKAAPGDAPTLPVLVDIYGGGFNHGSANPKPDKAQHFVRNGIVVVKFNYRVGPFGFLSTEDRVVPGNMGLKDQQLALQWVQDNIHLFGGDKTKVTLMGQSAGAASVTFHILSGKSSGLFRAAIALSGSVLNTFSYQRNAAKTAYGVAKLTIPNFQQNKTTIELIKALKNVSAKAIDATDTTYDAFGPVVEVDHEDAFVTQPFYDLSTKPPANKVPILMGMTSEEAIGHGRDMVSLKKYAERYDNDPALMEDECGCLNICYDKETRAIVGEKIRKAYTNGSLADDLSTVIKFDSEKRYTKAVIRFAQLQSQFTDIYFYVFSYHGKIGKNDVYVKGAGRVGHAEDAKYMYLDPYDPSNSGESEDDLTAAKRYSQLAINFIKELNPTPKKDDLFQNLSIPRLTPQDFQYINIDKYLEILKNPREPAYSKWIDLHEKYAQPPFVCF